MSTCPLYITLLTVTFFITFNNNLIIYSSLRKIPEHSQNQHVAQAVIIAARHYETFNFFIWKKKKINSFRIDQTSSKNTKRYSVKHLLIKYKLVFFDALHQCFASTLMQKDFFFLLHPGTWKMYTLKQNERHHIIYSNSNSENFQKKSYQ